MSPANFFFNRAGRLRSGWRFAIFTITFALLSQLFVGGLLFVITLSLGPSALPFLKSNWGFIIQAFAVFTVAFGVGWGCGASLEGLPLRALGWAAHRGWLRDWLTGSLFGASSLLLAAAIGAAFGGFRFAFNASAVAPSIARTLLISGLIFVIAAAAEEVLFRGYPLQTMTRAGLAWVGITLTSLLFAFVHLDNPEVVPGFTLLNTMLAGVWLAVAYWRTRSLWFPLGVHWSWNWMMGAVLGLPVSGISRLTPAPLVSATDLGPAWLTGGTYGIEGGAACTLALAISTIFIWRARLIRATEEMMHLTDHENPTIAQQPSSISPDEHTAKSNQPPASTQS